MAQPESFAKCVCQHCGGHIEFPAEGAGQKISCPHCQWPTVLLLPSAPVEIGGGRVARKRVYVTLATAACTIAVAAAGVYLYLQSQNSQKQVALPVQPMPSSNATAVVSSAPAETNTPAPKHKPPADPWHGLKASKVTLEKTDDSSLVYAIGTLTNETKRQ